MKMNSIITIGREFGSGGKEIGEKLAQYYGVKLYDKEMLSVAAKESGICKEIFETHDEKPTSSFLYSLVMDTYSMGFSGQTYTDMPINHKVFLAQFDAIRKIAEKGPCILVGRCADYALEHDDRLVSVFVHASREDRIARVAASFDVSQNKAKDMVQKTDKQRSSYYNYYTNKKWGSCESYDLCVDSSKLGVQGTIEVIKEYVRVKESLSKEERKLR